MYCNSRVSNVAKHISLYETPKYMNTYHMSHTTQNTHYSLVHRIHHPLQRHQHQLLQHQLHQHQLHPHHPLQVQLSTVHPLDSSDVPHPIHRTFRMNVLPLVNLVLMAILVNSAVVMPVLVTIVLPSRHYPTLVLGV